MQDGGGVAPRIAAITFAVSSEQRSAPGLNASSSTWSTVRPTAAATAVHFLDLVSAAALTIELAYQMRLR